MSNQVMSLIIIYSTLSFTPEDEDRELKSVVCNDLLSPFSIYTEAFRALFLGPIVYSYYFESPVLLPHTLC